MGGTESATGVSNTDEVMARVSLVLHEATRTRAVTPHLDREYLPSQRSRVALISKPEELISVAKL